MAQPAARPQLQEQGSSFMALPQSGCLPAQSAITEVLPPTPLPGENQISGEKWQGNIGR